VYNKTKKKKKTNEEFPII